MNIQDFIKNLAEQFEDVDASEFTADTNYQELDEWSSLTAMTIITMVKKQYGKTIKGGEIRKCKSVQELFNLVNSL
jgi:acyl carrier protein